MSFMCEGFGSRRRFIGQARLVVACTVPEPGSPRKAAVALDQL
jgi:hypothetical protein